MFLGSFIMIIIIINNNNMARETPGNRFSMLCSDESAQHQIGGAKLAMRERANSASFSRS